MSRFQKATKVKSKLRMTMYGPSGSGKTYTALSIATGIAKELGGKIAVIDSEQGSASKYADRFDFDIAPLPENSIHEYIKAIKDAEAEGYEVLVIDSLSHAWKWLVDKVEAIAKGKGHNNKWAAWAEGTPLYEQFMKAILEYNGHVVTTMRSKTEWVVEQGSDNKNKPKRVGTAPQQRNDTEYEFDIVGKVNSEHWMEVEKDRTGKFQDRLIEKPGPEFGQEMIAWLNEGAEPEKDWSTVVPGVKAAIKNRAQDKIQKWEGFLAKWHKEMPEEIYMEATTLLHDFKESLKQKMAQEGAA
ncbi:MAG: AAA family ATPase [Leptospiraceae bacterium]|nr:AAA family ATPase [Leptospiraceae bacterium]